MKKIILFLFSESFAKFIPLFAMPVYLKLAELPGYGEMSFFSALTSLLIPIMSLSYNNVVIKSLHKSEGVIIEVHNFVKILIVNSFILAALLFPFIYIFDRSSLDYYFFLIVQSFFCALFLLMKDFFIHIEQRQSYSIMVFSHSFLVHTLNIVMILLMNVSSDFWFYRFLSELVSLIICLAIGIYILKGEFSFFEEPFVFRKFTLLTSNIKLGASFLPRNCLVWYRTVIERKYILLFIDDVALGIYTVVHQLSTALTFPFILYVNYNGKNNVNLVKKKEFRLLKFLLGVFFGLFVIILGFLIFSDWLIIILKVIPSIVVTLLPIFLFALALSVISNYLLSLTVHSGSSNSFHGAVISIYIVLPVLLYFLSPESLIGVGVSVLGINLVYFTYSVREFLKVTNNESV